ncbi:MAG TPA: hypothetical protein VGE98_06575 [Thermoanaerobaculia bacterium]
MDHRMIDAENVAERYVTGRLSAEEAASFEEHYLDCPVCCVRIEAAERLERGLRRLAEEAAAREVAGAPTRPRAGFSGATARWLGPALAAVLALALLPAGFELREVHQLRSDLGSAREALAAARRAPRTPPTQPSTPAPDRLAALEGELREVRREVTTARRPQANLPVLVLTPVRDGSGGGPLRTLTLPRQAGWVALWVEPGGEEYPSYRVRLENARGEAVFEAAGLTPNDLGALLLTVHSSSLAPGAYRLAVDGKPASGAAVHVARFPVRIEARAGSR